MGTTGHVVLFCGVQTLTLPKLSPGRAQKGSEAMPRLA